MYENNSGLLRLKELKTFSFSISELTSEDKVKIKETKNYSLYKNSDQDKKEVIRRCMIAQMAERTVAEWVDGYVCGGQENHEDPHSFAYDVIAHPKYSGIRIEVKTHQSDSKWISVNTGYSGCFPGDKGINLGPFLSHRLADCVVIYDVEEKSPGVFWFTLKFIGDQEDTKEVVAKSNYSGWYMKI